MVVVYIVLAAALLMSCIELRYPGRPLPQVAGWWLRALLLNGVQVAVVLYASGLWDGWMLRQRPFDGSRLGPVLAPLLGYLALTFVYYWWHRARHQVPLLWRVFHQVHHSVSRLEVVASFYKHPLEILCNGLLSSAILYLGVGLDPQMATAAVLLTGLAELVYHWNVRTPHWLGYLFQRPESHRLHHQRGLHAFNYSDLPVWDMLFGTFRNPRQDPAVCGFEPEQEQRLGAMLLFVDLHDPRRGKKS